MDWEELFASRASRMNASEIREMLKLLKQPDIISFAGGVPDPALFPADDFQKAFEKIFASEGRAAALQYSLTDGDIRLREWIAGEMKELGIPCGVENIFITSGSQQALDYLGKLFLSPGDTALVNWPTYLGALGAFNAYEAEYDQLVPNGNRSADQYRISAYENGGEVKFAYMSVDFANPTGETLDRRERESILDLSEKLDIAIIEDAAYQSLRYDGEVIPPILALDIARSGNINKSRTVYCGSFSKTLAPGLRVGWVCAAQDLISQLILIKQASDLHSPTLNQMAIAEVAIEGFDRQVEKIRSVYRARRDKMLDALERHMPEGVSWIRPEGGMFVWLSLPAHVEGDALLKRSLKTQRVAFVPGRAFYADGSGGNSMRLSFSCADDATIEEGVRRLGLLLREAI